MCKIIQQWLKKTWTPIFFVQVLNDENSQHWKKAMDFEFKSLQDNMIWKCTHFSTSHKWISCKWIFNIKYNVDGFMSRHKVCLVANGITLVGNIDLNETFSFVTWMESICVVLTIITIEDFKVHQMDVKTTFLNVNC